MAVSSAPAVVCLGFFDGVHRGHLALIEAARNVADREHLILCVHTFDHAPAMKGRELTSLAERKRLLLAAGADRVAVSTFDEAFRQMSGEEFFQRIVLEELHARHVVCGDDHRFGHLGAWDAAALQKLCRETGTGCTVVPPVVLPNGMRISSTGVRNALADGDWALAEEMLGRKVPEKMKKPFL